MLDADRYQSHALNVQHDVAQIYSLLILVLCHSVLKMLISNQHA